MTGRETELDFYQPFSTQHAMSDYIISGGVPMTMDPYKEVAQCVSSVLVQEILTEEYSMRACASVFISVGTMTVCRAVQ